MYSVQKAIVGIDAEVIVVDNNSADESVAWVQENFSWITVIVNKENNGYARANNQGLEIAKGDYILFLNPDTILGEDCLEKAITILQQHADLGALGTRMIDGTGRFLPESKRGFPYAKASFFKLSGLIKIFPQSRTVGQYYLGWLPEKENHPIEVLSGAFMMVKKTVLEKTGGFDEQFFMYGEDIDLSYRIRQAGYQNYYCGEATIIHFKGESTKKDDIRYTKLFYRAMAIFVKKHLKKKSAGFTILMQAAISVSAVLSFARQLFIRRKAPVAKTTTIRTILAGDATETKKAAEILMCYTQIKRKITHVPGITEIYNAVQSEQADEVIFCTGTLCYKDIISCMENLAGNNIAYRFFAAGGKSIVGSVSKNSIGEIMVEGGLEG